LMEGGFFSRMITTFPPPHGCGMGAIPAAQARHAGIPSLMVHEPGEPLDKWHTSFDAGCSRRDPLGSWGQGRKKTLLMNWPVTFP